MLLAINLMLFALLTGLYSISRRLERANALKEADLRARGVEVPTKKD
jgi:hypothetical protein